MSSSRAMPLFRLSLAGLIARGSCWLVLVGAALFIWMVPLLTPWDENPQILQPARAQAAWIYAWLMLFTWLPFQASALGHRMRREGVLEHLLASGVGRVRQCIQLSMAIWFCMLAILIVVVVFCLTWCLPNKMEEAQMWVNLVLQYSLLFVLCASPLIMLAVALGTCTAEIIAFLVPTGLLFMGFFASNWLAPILGGSESVTLQSLWLALPHYHLADLTPRLVFKMGALPAADYIDIVCVLGMQGMALKLLGLWFFRARF